MKEEHFKKIVDALVELKNTSELMLDLAYSSIILNSPELAREVQELEEHVDDLHTKFELLILSSGFTPDESKDFLGLIRLGIVTEEIADAAAKLGEIVLRGLKPHPVLKIAVEEAEETVSSVQVSENSVLNGKTIKEARVADRTGMWILTIKRGKKWLRPKPSTRIKAGDILIASGYAEGEEALKRLASGETSN